MIQLFKLGWRNIFRNLRRTVLTGMVIGIGLAALIVQDALILGMQDAIVARATGTFLGQGQIHAKGFRESQDLVKTIAQLDELDRSLSQNPLVKEHALRVQSPSMLTSPTQAESVELFGIEPVPERLVSNISRALVEGAYLEPEDEQGVLIGSKLAKLLGIRVGERLVLTVAEVPTGDLAQAMFRVRGLYHFGEPELDRGTAFISLPAAQRLLGLQGQAHEIALTFTNPSIPNQPTHAFWKEASAHGNEALPWSELTPSLKALLELAGYSNLIVGLILLLLVLLTIMNTLFMALFERLHEFGILRAIGTSPVRLAGLILVEAAALAVVSSLIGIVLGEGVNGILMYTGINYEGIDIGGVTFRDPIYPRFHLQQVTLFPLILFVFTVLAALMPAISATRISPLRAMEQNG